MLKAKVGQEDCGLGLYATRLIRKGEALCSVLDVVNDNNLVVTSNRPRGQFRRSYAVPTALGQWISPLNERSTVPAFMRINHALQPDTNCGWSFEGPGENGGTDEQDGRYRVWVSIEKDIPGGTELLITYNQQLQTNKTLRTGSTR